MISRNPVYALFRWRILEKVLFVTCRSYQGGAQVSNLSAYPRKVSSASRFKGREQDSEKGMENSIGAAHFFVCHRLRHSRLVCKVRALPQQNLRCTLPVHSDLPLVILNRNPHAFFSRVEGSDCHDL